MNSYLFDTSALLAHFLQEPCSFEIKRLLLDKTNNCAVCVVTWLEFAGKLTDKRVSARDKAQIMAGYKDILSVQYDVDSKTIECATRLRDSVRPRLPAMDAIIAGCALANDTILVHKDSHMDAIPEGFLKSIRLTDVAGSPLMVREPKPVYVVKQKRKQRR